MTAQGMEFWEQARQVAARVAVEAWAAIRPFYFGEYKIFDKPDGPATEADRLADALIVERLQCEYPASQFGYLTEESEDDPVRLERSRVWIIDPIDGTNEFIRRTDQWVIQIGLVEKLEDGHFHPVAGVVYRPLNGWLYSAVRGAGAWRHELGEQAEAFEPAQIEQAAGVRLSVDKGRRHLEQLRAVVSKSNKSERLMRLVDHLSPEAYCHMGSLGVKLCTIAEGRAEQYVNLARGRVKEWDSCGPAVILTEAGGCLTDLDGGPVHYNLPDVKHQAGLLASNGPAHEPVRLKIEAFVADYAKKHAQS